MKFSVVVPARDEEKFIGKCFDSITAARKKTPHEVEVIVVLNRCTDRTEEMAQAFGAKLVTENAKNLSMIRNAGVKAATGDVIVTIDADSQMSPKTFVEIERLLKTGKFIGGGAVIKVERLSIGIILSSLLIFLFALKYRIPSAGLFWCYKKDFDAIGGFNEKLHSVEDLNFAIRLRAWGRTQGKRYGSLWKAPIVTSCRKFDKFGDWYFLRNPKIVRDLFKGTDRKAADEFYYDIKR